MSDSGVWGISQEYFDKVYPKQRKNFRVSVLTEPESKLTLDTPKLPCEGEARDSTKDTLTCPRQDSRGAEHSGAGVTASPESQLLLPIP